MNTRWAIVSGLIVMTAALAFGQGSATNAGQAAADYLNAGLWQDGLELIGSWCFFMHQKHLGVKVLPFKTVDVDFLIPRPYLSKKV